MILWHIHLFLLFILIYVVTVTSEAHSNIQPCSYYRSIEEIGSIYNYAGYKRICCKENIDQYYCLPNFIIIGTQKSGSTALAGLMASRFPSIRYSSKKEIHYFDKNASMLINNTVFDYMKNFEVPLQDIVKREQSPSMAGNLTLQNNDTDESSSFMISEADIKDVYYGDVTPFYIASRLSCKRIAKMYSIPAPNSNNLEENGTLGNMSSSSNLKLLMIVREPMERLYSEYQMKKRRIDEQDSLLDRMYEMGCAIKQCVDMYETQMVENIGSKLQNDTVRILFEEYELDMNTSKVLLFQTMFEADYRLLRSRYHDCMPVKLVLNKQFPRFNIEILKLADTYIESKIRSLITSMGANAENSNVSIAVGNTEAPSRRCFGFEMGNVHETRTRYEPNTFVPKISDRIGSHIEPMEFDTELGIEGLMLPLKPKSKLLGPEKCPLLRSFCGLKFGNEKVAGGYSDSIGAVLEKEYNDMVECGGEDILSAGNLSSIDDLITKCVRVRKGIASQYLYRSMYAAQLTHCFKYLPKELFLVIDNRHLRTDPLGVLKQVQAFLGLASNEIPLSTPPCISNSTPCNHVETNLPSLPDNSTVDINNISDTQLVSKIKELFPDFITTSGWNLTNSYPAYHQTLNDLYYDRIFRHQQLLLAELLNFTFKG